MKTTIELKTYQAGLLQSKAYRRLKSFMADSLSQYDLTMMEWALLGYIYEAGNSGARTSNLAGEFDVEASLMTNMVNSMERRRLVKRVVDPEDKRAKLVAVTEVGSALVVEVEQKLRISMRQWLKSVNRRHLHSYIKVLGQISRL